MPRSAAGGFTLIELLIVVTIIAILAAIAVPNFLEAQVRAKVGRAKADLRSLATALEAYEIDANHYPPDSEYYGDHHDVSYPWLVLYLLTTPVAYTTSIAADVFPEVPWQASAEAEFVARQYDYYGEYWRAKVVGEIGGFVNPFYAAYGKNTPYQWVATTTGPDRTYSHGPWYMFGDECINAWPPIPPRCGYGAVYDATNGTMSAGDIVRVGP